MICPPLTITFLGTGTSSGVPMIACGCEVCTSPDKKDNRLRSSILVQSKTTTLVVDTTPDFRYQMLRANVKKLEAVIFTHPHKDHALTEEALRREFIYAFVDNKYPGLPKLNINTITTEAFTVGDIPIIPIVVYHLNMPVLGFRFGKFTYITDANRIDENEKQKIIGSEVIVLNALRNEKHISHFSLEEAVALAKELNIPATYFTHMSHQMGKHVDVNKMLAQGMQLAWDGLELSV